MKTKTVVLYLFDELPTAKAKECARDWYREMSSGDDWWDATYSDAETAGLKITSFDTYGRQIEGRFISDATACAQSILKEHGEKCETYETAKMFLKETDAIASIAERDDDGNVKDEQALTEKLEEREAVFLHDILEDYLVMLQGEADYVTSQEYVDENIRANEYTFRENGKRED